MKLNIQSEFCISIIKFLLVVILIVPLSVSCSRQRFIISNSGTADFNTLTFNKKNSLTYAEEFSVEKTDGYGLIKISGEKPVLVIEENFPAPKNIPSDYIVCRKPLDKTYIVSTSVMDFLIKLDKLPSVKFSGTKKENWFLQEVSGAMENGGILYAGKYSSPDYELLLNGGCNLAVENTMIYHKPEVKEKLSVLGIPVIVEKSSYEKNPLGRLEWIKLYGYLYDREEEAESFFNEKLKELSGFSSYENAGKKIAFFYITSTGTANVRNANDYIPKMISIAGGKYFLEGPSEKENNHSTFNMQFESFYAAASDADILIYNSTIDGMLKSKQDLLKKNPLFEHFKAYNDDRIYCTNENFFQETTGIAEFIIDLNKIINGKENEFCYLEKIK